MNKNDILIDVAIFLFLYGWIMNVVYFLQMPYTNTYTGLHALRIIGMCFPPLGVFLGWFVPN